MTSVEPSTVAVANAWETWRDLVERGEGVVIADFLEDESPIYYREGERYVAEAAAALSRIHAMVDHRCEAEHIRNLREHESWNRSLGQKFRYLKRDVRKAFSRTTYTFKGVHGVADGAYEVRA